MTLRPESRARARALQLLYAWETGGQAAPDAVQARLDRLMEGRPEVRNLAAELFEGVVAERDRLDAIFAPAALNWRLERIAVLDRNILRLGVYELVHHRVPPKVAIDEALWLAHRFGGLQSPAFVNGVLDQVARSLGVL